MNKMMLMALILLGFSCTEISNQVKEESIKEVLNTLKVELVKTLPNPSVSEDNEGNITIIQGETIYELKKDRVFIDYIDDDGEEDVIYSVLISYGGNIQDAKHFAMLTGLGEEIEFNGGVNSNVIGISDKKIIVEKHDWKETDAMCCPSIKLLQTYSFIGNKFVLNL